MARILIVEDEPNMVAGLRDNFEFEGYQVLTALDHAALQVAQDQHPNVILLDLLMRGLDGPEVSRRLRANPRTAGIPIIAMSAHQRLQSTAAQMAVNDQLPKPFRLTHLYETVERWAATAPQRGRAGRRCPASGRRSCRA